MASWVELSLACDLVPETPQEVVAVLDCMVNSGDPRTCQELATPSHAFFQAEEWYWFLQTESPFLPGETIGEFSRNVLSSQYHLTIRIKMKWVEPILVFLDWLVPFVETQGFIGYQRNNESRDVNLILNINSRIIWKKVSLEGEWPYEISETG